AEHLSKGRKFDLESARKEGYSDKEIADHLASLGGSAAPKDTTDGRSILGGALADTFYASKRPGAVPLTGAPGTKTPLGVVLKPETPLEYATSAAVTAAPVAKAGMLAARLAQIARYGPIVQAAAGAGGRILASAGLGAAGGAVDPESTAARGAATGAAGGA